MKIPANKYLFHTFSAVLGLIFIFSAYTKLYPIEYFELGFVEQGLSSWSSAPFYARILIGIEFFAGLILLTGISVGKWFYKGLYLLLSVFSLYLLSQLLIKGDSGNCGCFGKIFPMTPLQGIFKNILMMAGILVIQSIDQGFTFRFRKAVITVCLFITLALPFILNPVYPQTENFAEEAAGYTLPLDILYNSPRNAKPGKELRKGKWVIAYISLTCPHCRIAAYKLHVLQKKNPDMPIHLVLNGKDFLLQDFFEETKSNNISHSMFSGGSDFIKMSGPALPAIFLIENGVVVKKQDYLNISESEIIDWINSESNASIAAQ